MSGLDDFVSVLSLDNNRETSDRERLHVLVWINLPGTALPPANASPPPREAKLIVRLSRITANNVLRAKHAV